MKCLVDNCNRKHDAKGFCPKHYVKYKRYGTPHGGYEQIQVCIIDECNEKHYGKGYCKYHWYRYKKYGDPLSRGKRGPTTGYINTYGYKIIRIDGKQIAEHRYLMEQKLGRKLLPGENIHHINGIKCDNRIENLELWSNNQPNGQRVDDKIEWAVHFLNDYGYKVNKDGSPI